MEKALGVLNELERYGVITRYALGGGIAAVFYMEPVLTYDLDVFVFLPHTDGGLISLSPIYDYLRKKRYAPRQEHVVIEGTPVQFIPAYNALVEEAVARARSIRYKAIRTRVLRAEHLLAIMLQTGRSKDWARVVQLLDAGKIRKRELGRILDHHGLRRSWDNFKRRFHET